MKPTLDGRLDRTVLSQLSHDDLVELVEAHQEAGIRINFSGKANARNLARRVRPRTLREVKKYGAGDEDDRARNLVIEGDNLQAMATLYRDRGQVDLVLADPPYNTGKDFRYNDRWEDDPNDAGLGELVGEDEPGRHTKWMRFMWPRLQMIRSMLRPGGVLAICIDHRELFRLGQMLDELFGEGNRLAILNWQRASTLRNDKAGVSTATEYVLIYAKDRDQASTGLLARTAEQDAGYRNRDNDPKGAWNGVSPFGPGAATHPGMVYAVQHPFTGRLIYPSGDGCWKDEKRSVRNWLQQWGSDYIEVDLDDGHPQALLLAGSPDPRAGDIGQHPVVIEARARAEAVRDGEVWPRIVFTRNGHGGPRKKTYLQDVQHGVVPSTYWADDDYTEPVELGSTSWSAEQSGTSEAGNRELTAIVGPRHGFETVKPIRLFQKIIQLWCPPNGHVLDPFAGSGTTGHAVLGLNETAGSDRRFTLIEQGRPERGDSYARTLLVNRLQRIVSGRWANDKGTPVRGGYRFAALEKKVDAPALLSMEREEMTDTVIASHFDANRRRGVGLRRIPVAQNHYLVAKNTDDEGFFLIWDGPDANTDFTEDVYEACAEESERAGLKPMYHVYARLYLFQTTDVIFYQIPDRILRDFGLDLRGEPFSEE